MTNLNETLGEIIRDHRPLTQIDDLEDWVNQYGMSAIIHDLLLIAIMKARAARHKKKWLDVCISLEQCHTQLKKKVTHDTRRG